MFQLSLFYNKQDKEGNIVDIIDIRGIHFNKEIGLYFKNKTIEEMITKFVLNAILNRVGMLWII